VSMVLVGDSADSADDWITEHISAVDVCVTSDIPLASRCLKKVARVVSPTGKQWTPANIGNALAGREIARPSALKIRNVDRERWHWRLKVLCARSESSVAACVRVVAPIGGSSPTDCSF
jgi:uncharacterized protein YaiI (UPF0178 family)